MKLPVKFGAARQAAFLSQDALIDGLRQHGIDICNARQGACIPPPEILLCDRISEALEQKDLGCHSGSTGRRLALLPIRESQSPQMWALFSIGFDDVLFWEDAAKTLPKLSARLRRWKRIDDELEKPHITRNLIGSSPAWIACLRSAVQAGLFSNAPILLSGPCGTGKELLARLIHKIDAARSAKNLVVVDCATLSTELAGSEFFGHEKGSYTGANGSRDGAFALADGGTLFLDEVGELPLDLQPRLLRAMQEGTYKRLGSNHWQTATFRPICATNRSLSTALERGSFRRDLYDRLAGVTLDVPDLAARGTDVLSLARHFAEKFGGPTQRPCFTPPIRDLLLQRRYSGNVRELKQIIRRTCMNYVGDGPITPGDLPADERPTPSQGVEIFANPSLMQAAAQTALSSGQGLKMAVQTFGNILVQQAIDTASGDLSQAAKNLHVTRRALEQRRAKSNSEAANLSTHH
ncbi:MAG: sigma 54-interacting transcriptional regulator [Pseudomonadota bacterium]